MTAKIEHSTEFGCARCENRWSGQLTAHCGKCHQNFSGESTFMKHLDHRKSGVDICRDPAELGMVEGLRKYQCWGYPRKEEENP